MQSPPRENRRWTQDEESLLISLRDKEHQRFDTIGVILNRTAAATRGHYTAIKQRQESSSVDWTSEKDNAIIDGRRRGLSTMKIAAYMQLSDHAVAGRWDELQRLKRVPEDVLLIWRHKEHKDFTTEEDEIILDVWMDLNKNDDQLIRSVEFPGRSQLDIRARRVELVNGQSPLYLKRLGMDKHKKNESNALNVALGPPKYIWMKK